MIAGSDRGGECHLYDFDLKKYYGGRKKPAIGKLDADGMAKTSCLRSLFSPLAG
jgi:hypothetical protein